MALSRRQTVVLVCLLVMGMPSGGECGKINEAEVFGVRVIDKIVFNDGSKEDCKTMEGKQGDCKFIKDCPPLMDLLSRNKWNSRVISSLQKVVCGYTNKDAMVCCSKDNAIKRTSARRRRKHLRRRSESSRL